MIASLLGTRGTQSKDTRDSVDSRDLNRYVDVL
jgi:hypothetical protein